MEKKFHNTSTITKCKKEFAIFLKLKQGKGFNLKKILKEILFLNNISSIII